MNPGLANKGAEEGFTDIKRISMEGDIMNLLLLNQEKKKGMHIEVRGADQLIRTGKLSFGKFPKLEYKCKYKRFPTVEKAQADTSKKIEKALAGGFLESEEGLTFQPLKSLSMQVERSNDVFRVRDFHESGWEPSAHQLGSLARGGSGDVLADLARRGVELPASVLISAAQGGKNPIVKALLEAGVSVNAVKEGGTTALMMAAQKGKTTTVKLLLKAGADVHVHDDDGATALHHAAVDGRREEAELLLAAGLDIGVVTPDGRTALEVGISKLPRAKGKELERMYFTCIWLRDAGCPASDEALKALAAIDGEQFVRH